MSESKGVPEDLYYSKDHEWARVEGDTAFIGITDYAQKALGAITFVDLPPVGKSFRQFAEIAAVESSKAASDIFAPLSGTVEAVNRALDDAPEKINKDPYGEGWLLKLKGIDTPGLKSLLTSRQYQALLEQEQK